MNVRGLGLWRNDSSSANQYISVLIGVVQPSSLANASGAESSVLPVGHVGSTATAVVRIVLEEAPRQSFPRVRLSHDLKTAPCMCKLVTEAFSHVFLHLGPGFAIQHVCSRSAWLYLKRASFQLARHLSLPLSPSPSPFLFSCFSLSLSSLFACLSCSRSLSVSHCLSLFRSVSRSLSLALSVSLSLSLSLCLCLSLSLCI